MSSNHTNKLAGKTVWELSYYKLDDGERDTRTIPGDPDYFDDENTTRFFIGIFSSVERAQAVVAVLSEKPGFRDDVNGFRFDSAVIDQAGWVDGFVSDDV